MIVMAQTYTIDEIKNINLEATDNYFGLIKECKNKIENINFEGIEINCNQDFAMKQMQYIGIVAFNSGDILNVDFNKINININNKSNYLGCIGRSTGYEINNVSLNEVYINGNNNMGGLFGNTLTGNIKNITASNIHIKTIDGDYIGGLVGIMTTSVENTFENVSISDSTIEGDNYVGGLVGSGKVTKNAYVNNCTIKGRDEVGGAMGTYGWINGIYNVNVTDSNISGETSVGGIAGNGGSLYDSIIIGSTIEGNSPNSTDVGGLLGTPYGRKC